jgi:hypothetical protein
MLEQTVGIPRSNSLRIAGTESASTAGHPLAELLIHFLEFVFAETYSAWSGVAV